MGVFENPKSLRNYAVGGGGGGGGGGAEGKNCLTDTTVVPAIRSKYLWRGSGPGVTSAIRKSIRKSIQKILLMFQVKTLLDGAFPPLTNSTFKPIRRLPNVAADAEDSITVQYMTQRRP